MSEVEQIFGKSPVEEAIVTAFEKLRIAGDVVTKSEQGEQSKVLAFSEKAVHIAIEDLDLKDKISLLKRILDDIRKSAPVSSQSPTFVDKMDDLCRGFITEVKGVIDENETRVPQLEQEWKLKAEEFDRILRNFKE